MPVTRRQASAAPQEINEAIPLSTPPAAVTVALVKEEPEKSTPTSLQHVTIIQSDKPENVAQQGQACAVAKASYTLRFPLIAISSLCIMSMGYSIVREWTGSAKEYSLVTRPLETRGEVALLASWRLFELALGWYGNFDSYDLAALAVLSHGPTLYLLHAFYGISLSTTLGSLLVEILCTFIPFCVLRPLSESHASNLSRAITVPEPNKAVISDRAIQILTTALAGIIYGVSLLTANMLFLPTYLVLYFRDIPSVEAAHVLSWAPLAPVMLLFGVASRIYIFTPAAAQGATDADVRAQEFDPITDGLGETLWYNTWGWHSATKVTIKRTAVAMVLSGGHTLLTLLYGIKGVEAPGAIAYASVWVGAALLAGFGLGSVGSDG